MSGIRVRIKQRRAELRLTQDDLGVKLGISRGAVCRAEREEHDPKWMIETLERYAKALDVTPWWLAFGIEER